MRGASSSSPPYGPPFQGDSGGTEAVLLAQHPEAEPRDEPPSQWPVFAAEVAWTGNGRITATPLESEGAPPSPLGDNRIRFSLDSPIVLTVTT